jgi:hypothetical protein
LAEAAEARDRDDPGDPGRPGLGAEGEARPSVSATAPCSQPRTPLEVRPRNDNDAGYPPVPNVRTLVAADRQPQLLERERELTALRTWMAAVGDERHGRLALVGGEAGVGIVDRRLGER